MRRFLNNWEINELAWLMGLLDSIHISRERTDMRRWDLTSNGCFTVRSCYGILGEGEVPSFFWYSVWGIKSFSKVLFFLWAACKGKILTIDNLQKFGFVLPNAFPLCLQDRESIDHIFIHCEFARGAEYGFCGSWFGMGFL